MGHGPIEPRAAPQTAAVLRVGQNAIATLAVVEPNGRAAPFQRLSHGEILNQRLSDHQKSQTNTM